MKTSGVKRGEFRIAVSAALAKMGAYTEDKAVDTRQLVNHMGADVKAVSTALNALFTHRKVLNRKPVRGHGRGVRFAYWLKGRKPPKEGTVAAGTPTAFVTTPTPEQKRDERYGKEVMLQVPCGDGQTRSFTVKQASTIYKYLHACRHLFKEGGA